MFARARRIFRTNPRGTEREQSRPREKVLTNSLYGDTSPIRKFFASRRICIYLRRAPCTRIIYFSPVVTQHPPPGRRRVGASPLFSPSDDGECTELRVGPSSSSSSNRYVFRVARLGIASWPGFAKEHSTNFDNHSKFLPRRPYVQFRRIEVRRCPRRNQTFSRTREDSSNENRIVAVFLIAND